MINDISFLDCFSASNLEMFTTFDQDNDKSKAKNCAVDMTSGWWFEHSTACTEGNLNGKRWSQEVIDKRAWYGPSGSASEPSKNAG